MCYLRASIFFISFRFLTFFSFLFFFFCFLSFLTILFSFFAFRFFSFLFVTFLHVFFSFFFLSVSFRFFSFFSVSQFTGTLWSLLQICHRTVHNTKWLYSLGICTQLLIVIQYSSNFYATNFTYKICHSKSASDPDHIHGHRHGRYQYVIFYNFRRRQFNTSEIAMMPQPDIGKWSA